MAAAPKFFNFYDEVARTNGMKIHVTGSDMGDKKPSNFSAK
jgi:hypothetical protein